MEPYKAKKLPFEFNFSNEIIKLLCDAEEAYGEYKGYLKSMDYDHKAFLECSFVSDTYYSFKLDNAKIEKENMFHTQYLVGNNEIIQFNNLKKCLLQFLSDSVNGSINVETLNKVNKTLFEKCRKNNNTKSSGKLRKSQNYLLKPGLAMEKWPISAISEKKTRIPAFMTGRFGP